MKFEDEEVYAPAESASKHNGMYLDYCEVTWHRPAYAACLNKITERKEGRLDVRFAGCSAAIGKKMCPALKLQTEEAAAGKAIYFINRAKLSAFNQYKQEMDGQAFASSVDSDNVRKTRRAAKRPELEPVSAPRIESDQEDGYAAAINAAMKNAITPTAPAIKQEVVPNVPRPQGSGMSMLEMARLKLSNKG